MNLAIYVQVDNGTGIKEIMGMVEMIWSDKVNDSDAVHCVNFSGWSVISLTNLDLTGYGGHRDIVLSVDLQAEKFWYDVCMM